jgi:hypothetical protein
MSVFVNTKVLQLGMLQVPACVQSSPACVSMTSSSLPTAPVPQCVADHLQAAALGTTPHSPHPWNLWLHPAASAHLPLHHIPL